MSKIINIFGGPGAGKTTLAAGIFNLLRLHGESCELISEYAKELYYEDRYTTFNNQSYVSAKQYHRIQIIPSVVKYIIVDSPILLGIVYDDYQSAPLRNLLFSQYNSFDNINYLMLRNDNWITTQGRKGFLEDAKEIDKKCTLMLEELDIPYTILPPSYECINIIAKQLLHIDTLKYRISVE